MNLKLNRIASKEDLVQLVDDGGVPGLKTESLYFGARGYTTELYRRGPDEAFETLAKEKRTGLVIIQSEIGVANSQGSEYTRENTDGGLTSGLVLLEKLIQANSDKFPQHAVIYSYCNPEGDIGKKIKMASRRFGVPIWHRSEFVTPYEFGEKVDAYYDQLFPQTAKPL